MLRIRAGIMSVVLVLGAPAALGGQWSSGGGELFRDTKNPWFPKPATDVRYCVQIDHNLFGVDQSVAERAIETALAYWKKELTTTASGMNVDVGTQSFHRVACGKNTDLTFQLGVLDEEQRNFLRDPTLFAAIAVRTDYDIAKRRGQGFIYVAPEQGSLRPSSVNLRSDPWRAFGGRLLELVLMHELGHVFGLGHINSEGLMDERFVDFILNRHVTQPQYEKENPQIFHFRRSVMHDVGPCWGAAGFQKLRYEFFDIPEDLACSRITVLPDRIIVEAKRLAGDSSWLKIGSASLDHQGALDRMIPMIFEYHPSRGTYWLQPTLQIQTRIGRYQSTRGVEREIFVELDPNRARIGGVYNGHIIPDLDAPFILAP